MQVGRVLRQQEDQVLLNAFQSAGWSACVSHQSVEARGGRTSYLRMLSMMAGLCACDSACRASHAAKGALSSYLRPAAQTA